MISSDFAEGKEVKRENAQSLNIVWAGSAIEEQGLPQYYLANSYGWDSVEASPLVYEHSRKVLTQNLRM